MGEVIPRSTHMAQPVEIGLICDVMRGAEVVELPDLQFSGVRDLFSGRVGDRQVILQRFLIFPDESAAEMLQFGVNDPDLDLPQCLFGQFLRLFEGQFRINTPDGFRSIPEQFRAVFRKLSGIFQTVVCQLYRQFGNVLFGEDGTFTSESRFMQSIKQSYSLM